MSQEVRMSLEIPKTMISVWENSPYTFIQVGDSSFIKWVEKK